MSPARKKAKSSKKAARAKRPAAKAKGKRAKRKSAGRARPSGKARSAGKPKGAAKSTERRHCAATDPFGDPCQSVPRPGSTYCTIHSYLDR